MQIRLPSFVQNISFNSAREVALRNPITVAVAAVALGIFALYSTYQKCASLYKKCASLYEECGSLGTISARDGSTLSNMLGVQAKGGIAALPKVSEDIARTEVLSTIRSKMTAPIMSGVFKEGNPFIAIAIDLEKDPSAKEVIILFQEIVLKNTDWFPKKMWSQMIGSSKDSSRKLPYFFERDFVTDLRSLKYQTAFYSLEVGKLCKNKTATDLNKNGWVLAKFDS